MNYRLIIILISTLLVTACSKGDAPDDDQQTKSISIKLSINTQTVNDPAAINQDHTFGSLAIYLYNNDVGSTLEQAALLSSFPSVSTREIPISTKPGEKLLYVIANYAGKTFRRNNGSLFSLTTATTRQELESLITESGSGLSSGSLLMVGKQAITITDGDDSLLTNIVLRRLQARVDVHVYKGVNFGSNTVTLEYIKFHNQVLNSEIKFDYTVNSAQMLTSPMFYEQTINNNSALSTYTNGTVLQPANAKAIFYSYQNLVTVFSPIQVTAPYLEIKLNANGTEYTYKGYFTDNSQTAHKYSLLQNNVYQIIAILDTDSKITLNMNILPWDQQNIEYERPVTAHDFSFGAWKSNWGGINGKTMNTNVGGLEDAVFEFELKAPFGAAWSATLTNGLDFAFTPSTTGLATQAVSAGFTNPGSPYVIAVRASKRWTGDSRDTELYITVEGHEIPINPVIGSQRRYQGTDTRIKITQVASYN